MTAPIPRLGAGDRLLLASHNKGKLAEFQDLFEPYGLEIVSAGELDLSEPEETGTTFAENARIKAHAAAEASGMLALSDDSGLCVDALGGKPGVYTANWAGPKRDFSLGMRRVEDALQAANATSPAERRSHFMATFCLADPEGNDWLFEGRVDGTIVWPPRGELGHGFDPVFMPEGYDITFGQMPAEMKHSWAPGEPGLSHRARAFAKFVAAVVEDFD
ncbi:non-canonical purine NTP pyrophosphatase [Devosia nitrariae]|uniref:dITP/XTP pyrophosphatase n=1 Tax=Devosia nitrariae TaxID=2071872 RepID=A0ABQ5WDH1_9HYPH|nr:non-canonical purine NTP pyrophosphatase [Devosia nitrariae]GLQ58168.1 non-canonical purine NTP pyrophosphatase [Devosia nitrariae]